MKRYVEFSAKDRTLVLLSSCATQQAQPPPPIQRNRLPLSPNPNSTPRCKRPLKNRSASAKARSSSSIRKTGVCEPWSIRGLAFEQTFPSGLRDQAIHRIGRVARGAGRPRIPPSMPDALCARRFRDRLLSPRQQIPVQPVSSSGLFLQRLFCAHGRAVERRRRSIRRWARSASARRPA